MFALRFFLSIFIANCALASPLLQKIDDLKVMKAQFSHKLFSENGNLIQEETGTVIFKKPGMFKWRVLKPGKSLVISDGKSIWNYDEDLEQVIIKDISQIDTDSPAFFLTGASDKIQDSYKIEDTKCTGLSCYTLVPKKNDAEFQKIELGFQGNTLKQLKLFDNLGQNSTLKFFNVDSNFEIQNKEFIFVVEEGIDVIQ